MLWIWFSLTLSVDAFTDSQFAGTVFFLLGNKNKFLANSSWNQFFAVISSWFLISAPFTKKWMRKHFLTFVDWISELYQK